MGRFSSGNTIDDSTDSGIDISPLIDCVFILLIFFIVTTIFAKLPEVDVTKARAVTSEWLQKNSIILAITPGGSVVYGDRDIGVSGVQPLVKRLIQKDPDLPVIIQADTAAPAGILTRVVGEAELAGADVKVATLIE
jgi:biopolymer transport protein ExbD